MVLGNSRSKVVHYSDCRLLNRISVANLVGYENIFYAKEDGYRLCKCCDPMVKKIGKQAEEAINFCRKRALSMEIAQGELIITTPFSEWKAYVGDGKRYVLYHKNTRDDISGYHLQTDRYSNVIALLKYIEEHDMYRMNHPLPKQKKKKSLPKKGTKKYRAMERRNKLKQRRREIRNVLNLIDSLSTS